MFSNVLFFVRKKKEKSCGEVTFNGNWLSDERFKLWLQKSKDNHKTICELCNYAVIDTAVMGFSALVSHAKRAKHQRKVERLNQYQNYFIKQAQLPSQHPQSICQ